MNWYKIAQEVASNLLHHIKELRKLEYQRFLVQNINNQGSTQVHPKRQENIQNILEKEIREHFQPIYVAIKNAIEMYEDKHEGPDSLTDRIAYPKAIPEEIESLNEELRELFNTPDINVENVRDFHNLEQNFSSMIDMSDMSQEAIEQSDTILGTLEAALKTSALGQFAQFASNVNANSNIEDIVRLTDDALQLEHCTGSFLPDYIDNADRKEIQAYVQNIGNIDVTPWKNDLKQRFMI